jgi:hypothetical protein
METALKNSCKEKKKSGFVQREELHAGAFAAPTSRDLTGN